MVSNPNRWAGISVAVLALLFLFAVIPYHSSASDYGWMRPRTLPTICAVSLTVFGAILAVFPSGTTDLNQRSHLRALAILGLLGLAVLSLAYFGFLVTAPILIAALMIFAGERRPLWLAIGVIAVPALIWFVISVLLGRPIP